MVVCTIVPSETIREAILAIQLFFSNQLEALADKYASMVDLENQLKENILEGPLTLVPNPNLMKWLQLTLAAKRSVFMNVDFQYLESGLWDLLARIDPRQDRSAMLTASHERMLLLSELIGLKQDDAESAGLARYLLGPDGSKDPGYAVRLWQLTERLTRLFESYRFHRADMIANWVDRGYQAEGMESSQQRLYLRLKGARDRYAADAGRRLLTLGEYADEVLTPGVGDGGPALPREFVHVFGLSQVSPFHLGLIGRLKATYDFFIYSLNPCREFWEDIRTPQERKWIQRRAVHRLRISEEERAQGELLEAEENELLALWGRPGREHIRLLCQLTDYDFEACFTRPEAPQNVLQAVQRHVLTLSTEWDSSERLSQDRSIQIVACPGITREVETVYHSILHNLEADPGLQLMDVAIFVPDISVYKPAIDSVFNRRPRRLPYNLVDSRADIESVYGQAVMAILDLAGGRFSRKEVFDLILNPCFMDRWQIRFEDAAAWVEWAEALNIFHSFDASDRAKRGYPLSDAYTWKQGLQRLRLSRILSGPGEAFNKDNDRGQGVVAFQGRIPFEGVHAGDTERMETFSMAMECLHRAVTTIADLCASGSEWAERFLRVCDGLLSVPSRLKGESAVKASLLAAFEDLKTYDRPPGTGSGETGFDIGVVREFVTSNLASISGGYGDYLTEGITISALQPMRPIPFRVVYVMGMGEGAFPGRAETSSLDLRLVKRRIGDVSLPERNRYLFLEMLLSVRQKLYLTYVARDLQKDRVIQPCSLVNQLRRYVEREILPNGERFRVTEVPLKGSSQRYLAPDAVNAVSDVLVNYSLADRVACFQEQGRFVDALAGVTGRLRERLKDHFPDFTLTLPPQETGVCPLQRITVRQLRMFLEDPVSQYLKQHLGVTDEEETLQERTLKEDEPFYSEFPIDYGLRITPIRLWLDRFAARDRERLDPHDIEEIYEEVYERFRLEGMTPEGAFAHLDEDALREDVMKRAEVVRQIMEKTTSAQHMYRAFFLGNPTGEFISPGNRLPVRRLEPLRLTVPTVDDRDESVEMDVEIQGQLPWLWQDSAGGWHALVVTGTGRAPGKKPDRYILEPLLFWLGCGCTPMGRDLMGGAPMTFHVAYQATRKSWTWVVEPDGARAYLNGLVSAYLNRQRPEWLPFQEAVSQSVKPHLKLDDEIEEGDRESFYVQLREAYSEETSLLVRLADPHVPEDAFDKARGRFCIFFQCEAQKTS